MGKFQYIFLSINNIFSCCFINIKLESLSIKKFCHERLKVDWELETQSFSMKLENRSMSTDF